MESKKEILLSLELLLSLDYENGLINYFNKLKEYFLNDTELIKNKINRT